MLPTEQKTRIENLKRNIYCWSRLWLSSNEVVLKNLLHFESERESRFDLNEKMFLAHN